MIEGAAKRTWVQGGVGAADARAAAGSAARGDGFGDSIASALERLLSGATAPRPSVKDTAPMGLAPSFDATAPEEREDEELSDLAAFASMDGIATTSDAGAVMELHVLSPRREASAERREDPLRARAAIDLGGMAVWEGIPWDGELAGTRSPFSERPSTTIEATVDPREVPTLVPDAGADLDDVPVPLVTKRLPRDVEALRSSPTEIDELLSSGSERRGRLESPSPETRSARTTAHGHAAPGDATPRREGTDAWGRERAEGRGRVAERRGAEDTGARDEGPVSRVHSLPVVTVGDREASRAVATTTMPTLEPWPATPPDERAPRDPAEPGAREDATPYHVARLGDHRARVELMHPELGRVEVEVTTVESRVDVELLARSLGASIALRSTEEELRGELRQRGASLRNYRVRTATAAGIVARAEEEDWR